MPSPPPRTRAQRRTAVARLALRGFSQAEIAAALNVHQATVSRDLRETRQTGRTAEARALRQADEAALARVNLLGCQLWDVLDVSREEGLFVARTKYHPRTGRRTEIDTLTELPGGEPRCFLWLIECGRLRQAIEDRMTGKRHREPYVLQTRIMRIADALQSLQRKYPPDVPAPSQPAASRQVPEPVPSVAETPARTTDDTPQESRIYAGAHPHDHRQVLASQTVTNDPASRKFLSDRDDLYAARPSRNERTKTQQELTEETETRFGCEFSVSSVFSCSDSSFSAGEFARHDKILTVCSAGSAEGRRDGTEEIVLFEVSAALGDLRGSSHRIANRTQRHWPWEKIWRRDFRIYAAALAQHHCQVPGGQSVATNSASPRFSFRLSSLRMTNRCRRPLPAPRARAPPTTRSVPHPRSAFALLPRRRGAARSRNRKTTVRSPPREITADNTDGRG